MSSGRVRTALLVVAVVAATLGGSWLVLRLLVRPLLRRTRDAVLADLSATGRAVRRVDASAVCLGRDVGRPQLRGNRPLVLTDDGLYFGLALPWRRLEVPLYGITGVEVAHAFTRRGFRRVRWGAGPSILRVAWDLDGVSDFTGWQLADADGWRAAIEAARSA